MLPKLSHGSFVNLAAHAYIKLPGPTKKLRTSLGPAQHAPKPTPEELSQAIALPPPIPTSSSETDDLASDSDRQPGTTTMVDFTRFYPCIYHIRLHAAPSSPPSGRYAFRLRELLPPASRTLTFRLRKAYEHYIAHPDGLARNTFLNGLCDQNVVLLYVLMTEYLEQEPPPYPVDDHLPSSNNLPHPNPRQDAEGSKTACFLAMECPGKTNVLEQFARFRKYQGAGDVEYIVLRGASGEFIIGVCGQAGALFCEARLLLELCCEGIDPLRVLLASMARADTIGEATTAKGSADPPAPGLREPTLKGLRYDDFVASFAEGLDGVWSGKVLKWEEFGPRKVKRLWERSRRRTDGADG